MNVKDYHDCYFHLLSFEKNFRQFTQKKIGNGDLTLAHIMILSYLHVNGTCGQKELTITFNASSAAMAVSIARLEDKGFIAKTTDPEDKRNNMISLTDSGGEYLTEFLEARSALDQQEPEADDFTRDDLRNLAQLQNKLFRRLKVVTNFS